MIEGAEQVRVKRIDRRSFLVGLGAASATITVVGAGLGALISAAERRRRVAAQEDSVAHKGEGPLGMPFPNADDPVMPVPGTRPEYTPVKDHYQVFIEVEPTLIHEEAWHLPITGLVDNPLMLSLDDLRSNYPQRDQYVTLSCISGRIPTTLISTTYWSGASVQDVLADAQVRPEARYLYITSGDGFYESVDLDLIRSDPRIMFCYGWDGNKLPVGHGFPLRIWIPDRFGMKQPKWITGVEVTQDYRQGYWVERNWDEVAQVKTRSVIDTIAVDAVIESGGETLVPIGGIAFSGARGISKVEVRVDGGPWVQAQVRSPLSETTWVIWRYNWPFESGEHTFEVRCAEGDETPQTEFEQPPRPSGATGIHRIERSL
jgi:DMSO/TMAO reductase YedYZ molybdopterin-dependent catalytic subunit